MLDVPWVDEVSNEDLTGWVFGALFVGRSGWDGGGLHPSKEAFPSRRLTMTVVVPWRDHIAQETIHEFPLAKGVAARWRILPRVPPRGSFAA